MVLGVFLRCFTTTSAGSRWNLLMKDRTQLIHFLHLQFHSHLWNSAQQPQMSLSTLRMTTVAYCVEITCRLPD